MGSNSAPLKYLKSHHVETRAMVADPIKSRDVKGWISGELGRPEQDN